MPNNIITKEWIDANDAAIQKKLQPLKDVKVVRVLSEAPQSWESLLTYTISNNTYSFKPGDEVRVPDNGATTGYTYYKLHKVENNTATWEALGESSAYQMCSITVTITSDGNTEPEGMSFTVTDNQGNVFGSGLSGETVMVPIGTNYIVSGSEIEGYQVESVQGTASETSVSVTLAYIKDIPNGVYAYYSNGSLRDLEHADSNAIGVAVLDDTCSFVIGKVEDTDNAFGGADINLSNIGIMITNDSAIAKTDFIGYGNTTKLVNKLSGTVAAIWCREQFNGKGYLPALGEWNLAFSLKSDINAMMTAIGGTAIERVYHWSSTLYQNTKFSWWLSWGDGDTEGYNRDLYSGNVRAFSLLYIPVTLTLSSVDGTSVSNKNVFIFGKRGESQTVTTDSTGKATANIAVGDIEIRVEGCRTLTMSVTLTAAMNNITVEIYTPEVGVYAYYADGTMKEYAAADNTAIGVAVVTNNCSFVIDKNVTNSDNTIQFGGYNKNLSDTAITSDQKTIALEDFHGEQNTVNIINACAGYTDSSSITGAPAAEACRAAFGGKGYLGSLGEWYTANENKSSINSMLTKIGGTELKTDNFHWSSTHYDAYNYSWRLRYSRGVTNWSGRGSSYYIRAFCAL